MENNILELVNSKKYLVFDFDGVILDSVGIKTDAFAELYASFGKDIVTNVVAHHEKNGGVSRFKKSRYYHPEFLDQHLSNAEIEILSNKFSNLVLDKILSANEIKGFNTFIDGQISDGKVCIINSATPEDELIKIIKHRNLTKYFQSILGSPLTKFENLEKIKAQFKCEYSDMVFFGDAVSDFKAAHEAGVDFVGLGVEGGILGESKYRCSLISDFDEIC